MLPSNRIPYEKPEIDIWTSAELDRIEATMSGGSGGGGALRIAVVSAPEPYQWFRCGTKASNTVLDISNINTAASIILSLMFAFVGNPVGVGAGVAIQVANSIAGWYVNNYVDTMYYKSTLYQLDKDAAWNTPMEPIWHPVGNGFHVRFYADSSYTKIVDETLVSDLDSENEHLFSYLQKYLNVHNP